MAASALPGFRFDERVPLFRTSAERIGESPHADYLQPPHNQRAPLPPFVRGGSADGRVRLVIASDIHNNYLPWVSACQALTEPPSMMTAASYLPPGDVFAITGDFTEVGEADEVELFLDFLRAVKAQQLYDHIVIISGNHEVSFDPNRAHSSDMKIKKRFLKKIKSMGGIHYLEDSEVVIKGLKFYGTPWIPKSQVFGFLPKGSSKAVAEFLTDKWKQIPEDVDVLMTHAPPAEIPGFSHHAYYCSLLSERLKQINPLVHCYGHVHGRRGIVRRQRLDPETGAATHSTWFVNSCIKGSSFRHPFVLDITKPS